MNKKVLIISGSPRKGGNSDTLCDHFAAGAAQSGNQVEKIWLGDKQLHFCTGCYSCRNGHCPHNDDAVTIGEKILRADVTVLATPVYFYTMCAQLKTLIDRSVMYYPEIKNNHFYFIMTMADTVTENFTGTIEALKGFAACCENSTVDGMICVPGVYEKGEIDATSFPERAFEMGSGIK
ncbi:MAG: flavodoxin family protein [Lentisphaeria bacterium]|nr:flavodoxin family protein [Lentisphaeria bacterium]